MAYLKYLQSCGESEGPPVSRHTQLISSSVSPGISSSAGLKWQTRSFIGLYLLTQPMDGAMKDIARG